MGGNPSYIKNCNIKIQGITKSHNGNWTCKAFTGGYGTYKDTINMKLKYCPNCNICSMLQNANVQKCNCSNLEYGQKCTDNTISSPSWSMILALSIPIVLLCLVLIVFLSVWFCCPAYLAFCCCCVTACKTRSDNASVQVPYKLF